MKLNNLTVVVLALTVTLATPAAPNVLPTDQFLPGLGETPGSGGAYFSSDAVLHNPGTSAANVTLELINREGAPVSPIRLTLMAKEGRRLVELLKLFTPAQIAGTMKVTSDRPINCTSQTLNVANRSSTYGLGFTAILGSDVLKPGDVGITIWTVQSADFSKGSRSNMNVTLLDEDNQVDVKVFDSSNVVRGSTSINGNAHVWQASVISLVPAGITLGRVEYTVIRGHAIAYTVNNDNVTSDGFAIVAETVKDGNSSYLVNSLAYTNGANGTFWGSDVCFYNPSSTKIITVSVDLINIQKWTTIGWGFDLSPGQIRAVKDVIPTFFTGPVTPLGAVAGSHIYSINGPLIIAARTTNSDPLGIRPGAFSASIPVAQWYTIEGGAPGRTYTFTGISQSGSTPGYRSNVAVFTSSNNINEFRLQLFSASGTKLAEQDLTINSGTANTTHPSGAQVWRQNSMSSWFPGISIPDDSTMVITTIQGGGNWYISRIDNSSGDAVVYPAFIREAN